MENGGEFEAWLRLLLTPQLGRAGARRLLAAFGSAEAVFEAPPDAQRSLVGADAAHALREPPPGIDDAVAATRQWLQAAPRRTLLTLADDAYPAALLQTADPPLLLFAEGRLELLRRRALAIVGSRHATPQGVDNARAFAADLGRHGFAVVSGLALGIDAAAHEGALASEGGTIAVEGTGLDQSYPPRNAALAARIAERGLRLSEFTLGTPPLSANFPQRNRVIAGLAEGTLVVEAAVRSGSLITARLAGESGREVFAIPGSIHALQARGCHALIKQGAKLVESAQDVLDELLPGEAPAAVADAGEPAAPCAEGPLLQALGHDPATLDALVARTGQPAATLSAQLLTLELEGRVARLPGGLFQRRAQG